MRLQPDQQQYYSNNQQQPYYNNFYDPNNHNKHIHTSNGGGSRKRQSRLKRNNKNGTMDATITTASSTITTDTSTGQDWGTVGAISSYRQGIQYDDVIVGQENKQRKRRKKKKNNNDYNDNDGETSTVNDYNKNKKRKSSKQHQKKKASSSNNANNDDDDDNINNNNDIRSMLTLVEHNDTIPSATLGKHDDNSNAIDQRGDNDVAKKRRFKKTKRSRSKTSSSISNDGISESPFVSPIPCKTLREFVEMYDVKNAGANPESLREFLRIVKSKKYIAWTLIYQDVLCTTPMLSSSKKYCTEKGPKCTMWNCTCDNQIRAMQASAPLLGAMFVFPIDCKSYDAATTVTSHNLDTFILPLAPTSDPDDGSTKDIDSGYERMAQWPFLSISCDTNLQQRWDTLRKILMDKHVTCVTFNAQVALMPYHFHCANDGHIDEDNGLDTTRYMDLVLPSIWDLRLASWMLAPHAPETDLEIEKKMEGFQHLIPKETVEAKPNVSQQHLGLFRAKQQLQFLYVIHPVIDKLLEENGLKAAFEEIEAPVQSVLSAMECLGVGFKPSRLQQIESNIEARINYLSNEAKQIAKDNLFMLSSPQQVSILLYEKMNITPPKRQGPTSNNKDTPQRSTSEETLKLIQQEAKAYNGQSHCIIDILLEFRGLSKMLNTYIKPYPKLARENHCCKSQSPSGKKRRSKKSKSESNTKMIYPMWMQTAVRTGRLSCRKPNLQQIPTKAVMGVGPRNAFIASTKESCLFACDYSQNEVRILAHMSGDEALISLFAQPGMTDIYKQMSSVINGKNTDSITSQERAIAKQVTLAIIYGMGLNNVAKKLQITKSTAQIFFKSFYGRFRGVKIWMDSVKDFARKHKYVTTITGRRR